MGCYYSVVWFKEVTATVFYSQSEKLEANDMELEQCVCVCVCMCVCVI